MSARAKLWFSFAGALAAGGISFVALFRGAATSDPHQAKEADPTPAVRLEFDRTAAPPIAQLRWKSAEVWSDLNGIIVAANRGDEPVTLDQISFTCACLALRRKVGDAWVDCTDLRLEPGESAHLQVRFEARGAPGDAARQRVAMRVNEGRRPNAYVEMFVEQLTGGLICVPPSADFGLLPAGTKSAKELLVVDGARKPRRLKALTVTGSPGLAAKLQPCEPVPFSRGSEVVGVVIGRIEVACCSSNPGAQHGALELSTDPPLQGQNRFDVRAIIQPPVELTPAVVVLPRLSGQGRLCTANCRCRAAAGEIKSLRVVNDLPEWLSVQTTASENPQEWEALVAWRPERAKAAPGEEGGAACVVELAASVAGRDEMVRLRVVIKP